MNIKKLTRVRLESPGCKYKETLLLQTKLIKTTTDDDGQTINKARKKGGLDKEHVNRLESSLAKGIDYSKNPPIVVRKNTLGKNGEKFEYVLITGHHRMEAFKNQGITEWLFDVYEVGTKTIPFDLAKSSLQIRENDHTPELANTADDLVNIISYLISKNHLTNSEKACGAPFVFDGSPNFNNRREVNFGSGDSFNNLWPGNETVCDVDIKTNGQFVMSDFGSPTFNNTVTLMENEDGEVNYPDLGLCSEQQVFRGDPPLDTLKATCLPPDGYEEMKRAVEYGNDHIFIDATTKLNWQPTYISRDTLIMTDIEFFTENGGGVKVKQWWYLMPPYLSPSSQSLSPVSYTHLTLPTNREV